MFNKKKKYCLFGQLACFIKIRSLSSNRDRRFYHCYHSYMPRYQLLHDTTFIGKILNKSRTHSECHLEIVLPTVCVFKQVPREKHACISNSCFVHMIGEAYFWSPRKTLKSCSLSEFFWDCLTHEGICFSL